MVEWWHGWIKIQWSEEDCRRNEFYTQCADAVMFVQKVIEMMNGMLENGKNWGASAACCVESVAVRPKCEHVFPSCDNSQSRIVFVRRSRCGMLLIVNVFRLCVIAEQSCCWGWEEGTNLLQLFVLLSKCGQDTWRISLSGQQEDTRCLKLAHAYVCICHMRRPFAAEVNAYTICAQHIVHFWGNCLQTQLLRWWNVALLMSPKVPRATPHVSMCGVCMLRNVHMGLIVLILRILFAEFAVNPAQMSIFNEFPKEFQWFWFVPFPPAYPKTIHRSESDSRLCICHMRVTYAAHMRHMSYAPQLILNPTNLEPN